jgi:hypothetical protein
LAGILTEVSETEISLPAAIDVQGTVTQINPLLSTDPGVISRDPEGAGVYRVGWKEGGSSECMKDDLQVFYGSVLGDRSAALMSYSKKVVGDHGWP